MVPVSVSTVAWMCEKEDEKEGTTENKFVRGLSVCHSIYQLNTADFSFQHCKNPFIKHSMKATITNFDRQACFQNKWHCLTAVALQVQMGTLPSCRPGVLRT